MQVLIKKSNIKCWKLEDRCWKQKIEKRDEKIDSGD